MYRQPKELQYKHKRHKTVNYLSISGPWFKSAAVIVIMHLCIYLHFSLIHLLNKCIHKVPHLFWINPVYGLNHNGYNQKISTTYVDQLSVTECSRRTHLEMFTQWTGERDIKQDNVKARDNAMLKTLLSHIYTVNVFLYHINKEISPHSYQICWHHFIYSKPKRLLPFTNHSHSVMDTKFPHWGSIKVYLMSVRFCLFWSHNFLVSCRFMKAELLFFKAPESFPPNLPWLRMHNIMLDNESSAVVMVTQWMVGLRFREVAFSSRCMHVWYFGDPPWAWLQGSVRRCAAGGVSLTIRQQSAVLGGCTCVLGFFCGFPMWCLFDQLIFKSL